MSSPPTSGSGPNTPAPPQSPGVPTTQPDRGAGPALAGFLCGLVSLVATMLGAFVALRALYTIIGHDGFISGEVVWLLVAAFPVALVGLLLSIGGRHSTSRRWLAIAGMVLSSMFAVSFFLGWLVIYLAVQLLPPLPGP